MTPLVPAAAPPDPAPWTVTVSGPTWADVSAELDTWRAAHLLDPDESDQFTLAVTAARGLFDAGHHPAQPATVTINGFSGASSSHLGVVVSG